MCPFWFVPSAPLLGRCLPTKEVLTAVAQIELEKLSPNSTSAPTADLVPLPKVSELGRAVENVLNLMGIRDFSAKALHDLKQSWDLILACLAFALGFSFVWVYSIRFFAYLVVWTTLILSNLLMALAATWSLLRYFRLLKDPASDFFSFSVLFANDFGHWVILIKKRMTSEKKTPSVLFLSSRVLFTGSVCPGWPWGRSLALV